MRVIKIAAGRWHCAALTDDSALYTWSGWENGPAPNGLGYEIDEDHFAAMTPRRVQGALDGVRLRCLAAGSSHTLVASEDGELLSFGGGESGCLGHGNQGSVVLPKFVQALSPARGRWWRRWRQGACGVWR
jgi:alpha-tubulin suppressor-like RCC1 family protein